MIELFSANTPNGKKISIMLEEIGYDYKVTNIDINNGDQFKEDFKKISPFSKIPVIIDHIKNNFKLCEFIIEPSQLNTNINCRKIIYQVMCQNSTNRILKS